MGITQETFIMRASNLIASDLDGETVLMSQEQGRYFGLDEVGSRIWDMIAEPMAISRICDALMDGYNVSRAECEKDILDFAEHLLQKKIIRLAGDAS